MTVALAVPRWIADGQNCDLENTPDGNTRYTRVVEVLHDENTGRDEKPVQLGRKNIRLVIEGDDRRECFDVAPGSSCARRIGPLHLRPDVHRTLCAA